MQLYPCMVNKDVVPLSEYLRYILKKTIQFNLALLFSFKGTFFPLGLQIRIINTSKIIQLMSYHKKKTDFDA